MVRKINYAAEDAAKGKTNICTSDQTNYYQRRLEYSTWVDNAATEYPSKTTTRALYEQFNPGDHSSTKSAGRSWFVVFGCDQLQ